MQGTIFENVQFFSSEVISAIIKCTNSKYLWSICSDFVLLQILFCWSLATYFCCKTHFHHTSLCASTVYVRRATPINCLANAIDVMLLIAISWCCAVNGQERKSLLTVSKSLQVQCVHMTWKFKIFNEVTLVSDVLDNVLCFMHCKDLKSSVQCIHGPSPGL